MLAVPQRPEPQQRGRVDRPQMARLCLDEGLDRARPATLASGWPIAARLLIVGSS
jgi:hypothetical protein